MTDQFEIAQDSNAESIVWITVDGDVKVNPKYTVTEAARAFWDQVVDINPLKTTRKRCEEAEAMLEELLSKATTVTDEKGSRYCFDSQKFVEFATFVKDLKKKIYEGI